jgi:uncharacterized protein (TIGR02118 family)
MYKVYFLLQGPQGLDPFRLSGADAASAARSLFPSAAGYVQSRTLVDQVEGRDPPGYSGIAELWFQSATDAMHASKQEVGSLVKEGVRCGPVVTGLARTVMRLPSHHTAPGIKGVFPFRRKAGMPVPDFQRHWWQNHGPIAALTESALCYIQVHPPEESYNDGAPHYDGITELHWPDADAANQAMVSRQMSEDQGGDAPNFVDLDSIELFLVNEEIVVAP